MDIKEEPLYFETSPGGALQKGDNSDAMEMVIKEEVIAMSLPEVVKEEGLSANEEDVKYAASSGGSDMKGFHVNEIQSKFGYIAELLANNFGEVKEEETMFETADGVSPFNEDEQEVKPENSTFANIVDNTKKSADSSEYQKEEQLLNENRHHCVTCGKAFRIPSELKKHKRIHTAEKPFNCSTCNKSFKRSDILIAHQFAHTGQKPHRCNNCQKGFSRRSALNRHIRTHVDDENKKCDKCGKLFAISSKQIKYKRILAGGKLYCSTCETCDLLMAHQLSNNGEKPHKCKICNKEFSWRSGLTRHIRIHTGVENQHICDICKKGFAIPSRLRKHLKIHMGMMPYCCSTCGRTFRESDAMKKHQLRHTGERPYCCNLCKKRFYTRAHLVIHVRSHTGEKPYLCESCGKMFRNGPHLPRHLRVHTREAICYCDTCGKEFHDRDVLTRHILLHSTETTV